MGAPVAAPPEQASFSAELDRGARLVLEGPELSTEDKGLLRLFVAQVRAAQERTRLQAEAAATAKTAAASELSNGLLGALSRDLREYLASMNATATGALAKDEPWSAERVHAFCAAIMRTTERLARTAAELGDMSRLTDAAGSDSVQAVELDGAIRTCIANPSVGVARTPVDVSRALPPVLADRPETGPGEGGPTGRIAALTTNATDMSIVVKDIDERRRKGLADLARERTKSGGAPTMGPQGGQPRSLGGAACFHDRFGTGPWRCSSSRSFRCWPSPCRFGASPQAGSETPGLRRRP